MNKNENILISLESRHANNIYSENKTVELRRRAMNIAPGSTVWFYEKIPVGSITGCATIFAIHTSSPAAIWDRFCGVSGLSENDFFSYFAGAETAFALELISPRKLESKIPLKTLRKESNNFHPPQFFIRLPETHPILKTLRTSSVGSMRD